MPLLEYNKWQNFNTVIEKSKTACQASNYEIYDQFTDVSKLITGGKGNKQKVSSRRHAFQQFPYSAEITLPALSAIFFEYYPSPKHSGDLSDES